MRNKYGIPEIALSRIRKRDTHCLYCGVLTPARGRKAKTKVFATIEHLYPPGNDPTWVCFCCNGCNAAHRMPLREWFKTEYCLARNINEKTVASPIKRFLKSGLKEYYQMRLDGQFGKIVAVCGEHNRVITRWSKDFAPAGLNRKRSLQRRSGERLASSPSFMASALVSPK